MEHYLVTKRNEALTHATTQMNPENTVLRSHIQKNKYFDSTYVKSLDMQIHKDSRLKEKFKDTEY